VKRAVAHTNSPSRLTGPTDGYGSNSSSTVPTEVFELRDLCSGHMTRHSPIWKKTCVTPKCWVSKQRCHVLCTSWRRSHSDDNISDAYSPSLLTGPTDGAAYYLFLSIPVPTRKLRFQQSCSIELRDFCSGHMTAYQRSYKICMAPLVRRK